MAQMAVSMTLTLADAASGPLRAFQSLLTQIEATVTSLQPKLAAITAQLSAIGAGATSSTAGVGGLGSALGTLGGHLGALVGQVGALTGALGTATTAFGTMGTAAATTGGAMNQHLAATNTQAMSLGQTLKGVAELWAAVKIEKGLKESAQEAMAFQNTETRLRTMNVSPSDRAAMTSAAEQASRDIPQFNKNEMLTMAIDLRNATGSVDEAIHMLPEFAKAIFVLKSALPPGVNFGERDTLNVAKVLEQRNATLDPAKMQVELDMIAKIYAATQGRVDASSLLGNLQQAKGGLGQAMDVEALPFFAAVIQELRSSGSGGSAGTMLTTLQRYVLGNVRNGISAKEAGDLGLVDDQKLVYNSQGNINLKKSDLTMAGADEFQRNPFLWIENYLKPALVRAGIDLTNDAAVNQVLAKLFPDRNAAQFAGMAINRGALIGKEAGNINQALGVDGQYAEDVKNASAAITEFKAQLENLAIVMGTTLLPAISSVAHAFSEGFQWLAGFFKDHPVVAQIATWAAVIVSLGLALAGLAAIFGGLGIVGTVFGALGVVIMDVVAGIIAVIGGPLTLVIAAVVAAWQFGFFEWLGNVQVFGKSLSDWASQLADTVVTAFANMWIRTKAFFGFVDDAAAQAEISANNRAQALRGELSSRPVDMGTGDTRRLDGWGDTLTDSPIDFGKGDGWGGTTPRGKGKLFAGGRGSDDAFTKAGRGKPFNADANLAGNEFKREEDDLRTNMKALDAIYKAGSLSVDNYYIGKQAALESAVEAEIAILNRERAAFLRAGDTAGVNRVDTQLAAARNKLAADSEKNEADRTVEMNKLRKDAVDMERALLSTTGQRRAAEALHAQEELRTKLQVLVLNQAETGVSQEMADSMMARAKAASDLKLRSEEIGKIENDYADRMAEVTNAEKNGTLSQTAAEDRKLAIRKEEAQVLDQEILKQLALAEAAGDEAAQLKLKKALRQNEAVEGQLPADQIAGLKSVQSGFGNFFNSLLNGTRSVGGAFRDLGRSISESMNRVISQRLGDALFDSLFGATRGSGAGGGAGLFGGSGGLFSGLGSLFGGGYGFAGTGVGASLFASDTGVLGGSVADALAAGVMPLAKGMDYVPQDMLAVIHQGERVMTAADNASYGSGGRSQVNHINIAPPAGMSKQAGMQLGVSIAKQIAIADRRNN